MYFILYFLLSTRKTFNEKTMEIIFHEYMEEDDLYITLYNDKK